MIEALTGQATLPESEWGRSVRRSRSEARRATGRITGYPSIARWLVLNGVKLIEPLG